MANVYTKAVYDKLADYIREQGKADLTAKQIKALSDEVDSELRRAILDGGGARKYGPSNWASTFHVDENVPDGVAYEIASGEFVINATAYAALSKQIDAVGIDRAVAEAEIMRDAERSPPPDPNFPRKLDID